ncbi:hypothetical protein LX32DRAFT_285932 [Colletotrichum zoysiae]|uniref:Uncharacterized protein n=1 Tax=Colletotrichum zoysiae TaxID=1216348 RepID=A0AAD9H1W2_9PEZI|nr:hypothetical protein LX32DRAFT_285932 [Colletotrichum zoysiae]
MDGSRTTDTWRRRSQKKLKPEAKGQTGLSISMNGQKGELTQDMSETSTQETRMATVGTRSRPPPLARGPAAAALRVYSGRLDLGAPRVLRLSARRKRPIYPPPPPFPA